MRSNKIISCILSAILLIMTVGSASVFAEQDVFSEDEIREFQDNIGFLKAIGVIDESEPDISQTVTRAEMVKTIMMTFGVPAAVNNVESPYSDVDAETPNYGYIMAATQRGIVNGDGGTFRPNDKVLYEEAAKIAVSLLGYDYSANEAGGYPSGYLAKATQLGLLSPEIGYNGYAMGWFGFSKILVNAVKTDMVMATVDSSGEVSYKIGEGRTILRDIFHLDTVEGIVTRNIYTGLTEPKGVDGGVIEIGKKSYKTDCDTKELIGCKVKAYINDDNKVVYIEDYRRYNNVLTLDDENLEYDNFAYKYTKDENGKTKTAKLSNSFNLIRNNVAKSSFTEEHMIPENGYVELIDANDDNVYETVKVFNYRYMLVNRVDEDEEVIYGKHNGSKLLYKDAEIFELTDSNGKEKKCTELSEYDLLKITESDGGEVVYIEVSNEKVRGKIDKINTRSGRLRVTVNGVEYKAIVNPLGDPINAGDMGVLYITNDGEAAAFDLGNPSGTMLGALIDAAIKTGLNEKVNLKVLTETGNLLTYECDSKVYIDGIGKKTGKDITNALKQGNAEVPVQPIFYTLNDKGKVKTIDTAYNINAMYDGVTPTDISPSGDELRSSLRRVYQGKNAYRSSQATLNGKINLSDSAKLFSVPENAKSASEDDFLTGSRNILSNDASYTVDAYSSTETDIVSDIVIVRGDIPTGSVYGVVTDIYDTFDAETSTEKTVLSVTTIWNSNIKLVGDKGICTNIKSINSADENKYNVECGDFVLCTKTQANELRTIKLVADASAEDALRFKGASNPTSTNFSAWNRMIYGKVEENYKGIISVNTGSAVENCTASKFKVYRLKNLRTGNAVEAITAQGIYDAKNFGDAADYALIFSENSEGRIIVVY